MTNKVKTTILTIIAAISITIPCHADPVNVDGIYYNFNNIDMTASVTYPYFIENAYQGDIVIPETVTINEGIYNGTYTVTSIGSSAFSNESKLTSVKLPNTIKKIYDNAFSGCQALESINIPQCITEIRQSAFYFCKNLNEIILPDSLKFIGNRAFESCTSLTSIKIPQRVDSIGTAPFLGCQALTAINVDEHNATFCSVRGALYNKEKTTLIEVPAATRDYFTVQPSVTKISEYAFYGCDKLHTIFVLDKVSEIGNWAFGKCSKLNSLYLYSEEIPETGNVVGTELPKNSTLYIPASLESAYDAVAATPAWRCFTWIEKRYKCLSIELIDSTSTSMTLVGRHPARYDGTRTGFYRGSIRDGIICEGDTLVMKSMTPNNEFMCHYFLGSEDESLTFKFTTPELILNIENPQGVSATSTIVAAETNLSEEEAGAGFQWRKYDAPETLPWSEANAAIYGGRLEGIIRNLQPTSYYNVRAFYKSASGNYYYSDFVTFDPSDFSYFEPTVHTYPAESVTAQTADVRGYVLPGTDEITSQGFEYRPASASNAPAKRIAATPKAETAAGTSVVMATGQVMTATITDLAPATTYTMRAFATTQAGTTYGEEQTFTTATMSGIQAPATATTPTVTGYYDMSGRKLDAPQKGLTIVRYSDGTAKKIFTR